MESEDTMFFGELLRSIRLRKNLTQQQLAEQIGVHRDSISSWERGEFNPETPTMVHELARILGLSEDEKRLFFEALYGTASVLPLHNLPEHNVYFTGREEILSSLHIHLTAGKQVALIQTQAVSGLGGIGKTQVAIEYAYRFREHYHDILWAAADSQGTLITSYLTLARLLRLREREEQEQHKVVDAVKRWLREHKHWLLILDNIEDLSLVREFVPTPQQGAVVLTTRREETQPVAQVIVLDIMPEEEGILFLLKRAGHLAITASLDMAFSHDTEAARAIVGAVEGLPLALDQAGAYIAETRCSLLDYLGLFKQEQRALLQRRGTVPSDHPQSVTKTFSLAFGQIQQKNEVAIELLKLCAYLAPDAIPEDLITKGSTHLGKVLGPVAADPFRLNQAMEVLGRYSLLRRTPTTHLLSIHRLVQAVLKDKLDRKTQRQWAARTVQALNKAFPDVNDVTAWPDCDRYLPHALAADELIRHYTLTVPAAAGLLSRTASYLVDRARYPEAEPLLQHALAIWEKALGPDHPDVATCLNNLGVLYRGQGKYEQAEMLYQRALAIREKALGPDHPHMAQSLNNLGVLYRDQGKYEQAEPLLQRSLITHEKALGPDHPRTAISLNYLGVLYRAQGKYEQAEPLFQQALHIREQQLGPNHPDVAISLNSLASLYLDQGKYAEAELLFQQALHIREQKWGSQHPETAETMYYLARLRETQGKSEEAKVYYSHALTAYEQALGNHHPKTTETRKCFITLLQAMGQHEEAVQFEVAQPEHGINEEEQKIHPEE